MVPNGSNGFFVPPAFVIPGVMVDGLLNADGMVCLVPTGTEECKATDDHQVFHSDITLQNTEYFLAKFRSEESVCITMQH
jgi:hypothetical protein